MLLGGSEQPLTRVSAEPPSARTAGSQAASQQPGRLAEQAAGVRAQQRPGRAGFHRQLGEPCSQCACSSSSLRSGVQLVSRLALHAPCCRCKQCPAILIMSVLQLLPCYPATDAIPQCWLALTHGRLQGTAQSGAGQPGTGHAGRSGCGRHTRGGGLPLPGPQSRSCSLPGDACALLGGLLDRQREANCICVASMTGRSLCCAYGTRTAAWLLQAAHSTPLHRSSSHGCQGHG